MQQAQQVHAPVSVHNDSAMHYSKTTFTYLALGDSYTIGQSIPENENYPHQVVSLLKKDGLEGQLKIIATTGWTTDQLEVGISSAERDGLLLKPYDIVTLLIGVNNQYRGDQEIGAYKPAFEELLIKAISLAN
ncbi:MAG: GDSL-type esterase/lipase family protein, partial [Bacteroidota bacterium]